MTTLLVLALICGVVWLGLHSWERHKESALLAERKAALAEKRKTEPPDDRLVVVCRHVYNDMTLAGPQVVAIYEYGRWALCCECFHKTKQVGGRVCLFQDDEDHGEDHESEQHFEVDIHGIYDRGITIQEYDAQGW
jgi:hypothetical protein